ncbi:uncharacterized protein K452DRAFT_286998 [Aplosporella prunicola CBS 121167]|uniref:Uncharacterized protein n=1 Tax=Aplosporella prunicola CBS 121167 TaxID=1176127 RepID=A0A6A6BGX8_9PEZI|nr:uncharacterized protein K452DRAFT_286998 [Aplosporella prunicola CBS 121167]KAF2142575.1 hypothetical protein K452DRAFT_286998 [Aplosporella prunicola CBS 121167]
MVIDRGRDGDELEDYTYNMTNPRRRSNSTGLHTMKDFKTKFETIDPEPVFEEEVHGPTVEHNDLEKMSSGGSSNSENSVQEDDQVAKKA